MNKYEILEEKLKKRSKILGTTMSLVNSPLLVEKMNREELNFILFDSEHGVFNNENAIHALQVCRLMGLPAFIRVADSEYHLIARAIYMGADGVMLPRTETLEQIETAISGLRFPETGKMGCGGHGQFRPGESFVEFGKSRHLFIQIESREGIDNLPQMLETYGDEIAAVIVGPYDMSVMLGTSYQICSDVMKLAVQEVFDICARYNKSCGIFCDDEVLAKAYREMGANVLWACTDINFFMRGYNQVFDALEGME